LEQVHDVNDDSDSEDLLVFEPRKSKTKKNKNKTKRGRTKEPETPEDDKKMKKGKKLEKNKTETGGKELERNKTENGGKELERNKTEGNTDKVKSEIKKKEDPQSSGSDINIKISTMNDFLNDEDTTLSVKKQPVISAVSSSSPGATNKDNLSVSLNTHIDHLNDHSSSDKEEIKELESLLKDEPKEVKKNKEEPKVEEKINEIKTSKEKVKTTKGKKRGKSKKTKRSKSKTTETRKEIKSENNTPQEVKDETKEEIKNEVKEEVKEIEEIKGENVDEKEIRINKLKASTMMSLSDPIEFGSHDSDINEDLLSEEMKPSTIEEELKNVDEDEQLSESIVDSEKIPISEYEFTLIQFIELLIKYPDGQDNKEAFQLTLEYNTNEGKKEKIVPFSKSGYVFPGIMFFCIIVMMILIYILIIIYVL